MKFAYLWSTAVLATFHVGSVVNGGESSEKAPQIIVLKLDDVTAQGGRGNVPVSSRWQRVTDFIEKNKLKATYGIISWSLEQAIREGRQGQGVSRTARPSRHVG